ncbi:alpha/beta fold hydrolase [Effusibacillus dendaii]|uniref:3-oxoadipate enol-lactone hydrolase n=1 Tax=Effusibacillus dendaii TaxID=2743772 RepID=A0A7I8DHY6_9BACL|nr:alpha/beta hydrolase [Effusibacillus dendaii]BCJ88536.1 3-oxoadipate enol-lactone hydrolase [Effusibacillus dendaii]
MFKQINGTTLNYEVKGNGPESVVFVHGLGGSLNIWHSQVKICSRYFKTLTYDLRGSGRSDISVPEYSINLWVEDLKSLLETEAIERAHFVGHSMGTLIIQHFAVAYPEMVASLTLVGGITEIPEAGKKGLHDRANLVKENGMDAVADLVIEGGLSAYSKHANSAVAGLVRELLQRNDAEAYGASCKALANGMVIAYEEVKVPVLLIVGDEDNVSPISMAKQLYDHFPNAKVEVLADCGHWATVEKPSDVNRVLLSFLKV